MKKIKNLAVICFAVVLLAGLVFNTSAIEYAVKAEAVEISEDAQEDVQQGDESQDIQQPDPGNGDSGEEGEGSSGEGDTSDVEDPGILVNGAIYTGYYMDNDGIMYMVTDGVKGSAVTGVIAEGACYYNSQSGASVTFEAETIYVSGKTYSGYYLDSTGKMFNVSDGIASPTNGTISKGKTYYNGKNGETVTLSKSTVYVAGKLYSGYYLNSLGKMYKVSNGTATAVRGTMVKGKIYYSYNDGKKLTLSKNTVYVKGELYSGYYMTSNERMYKVSKGTATAVRGTMSKGKVYYSYNKAKTVKLGKATVYVNGKLYSGYYLNSLGKMYKVSKGNAKALSATLKKGTKYYSYNSAKTLKLSKKTVYVKGNSANVWAKENGTWCYHDARGKVTFKSNVMYNAWKKINSKSSKTKYFMVVDTNNTKTMIFKGSKGNWVPYKLWSCSPGKASTPTVKGTYTVKAKGYSFGSGYTCYYYTQFYGNYLFHSILYNQGTFKVQDGRLGQKLSHGCVRLSLSNAKWVYKNIPRNTKVYIY